MWTGDPRCEYPASNDWGQQMWSRVVVSLHTIDLGCCILTDDGLVWKKYFICHCIAPKA